MCSEQATGCSDNSLSFFDGVLQFYKETQEISSLQNYIHFPQACIPRNQIFRLYEAFIDHHVDALEIPHSSLFRIKEFRPLYDLIQQVDPEYFLEDQISHEIQKCFGLPRGKISSLLESVLGFIAWWKQHSGELFQRALSERALSDWCQLFSTQNQWA